MDAVGFYIFFVINRVMSLLPLRVLYLFSDFVFFILYHFPSYRRKVVRQNLEKSFPEKSKKELRGIEKKFYHHLADVFIEIFKMTNMSSTELAERVVVTNPELLDRLFEEDRDLLIVMGHYNNWEWLQGVIFYCSYQAVSIYKPLRNKKFDAFARITREQYGMILTPMANILREIISLRNSGTRGMYSFITDQTPAKKEIRHWTNFLNQDTPVYTGVEKIASKYDMAVVFLAPRKVRRGYYEVTAELLFEHATGVKEHEITEAHVKKLEELIREEPAYWMWSHRRWKHKRPEA
jgi:KDO2-lipid IV(A) lauroyltransferase